MKETRKMRKIRRKQKSQAKSGLSAEEEAGLRKLARILTQYEYPREWCNKKVNCKTCGKNYCMGFDETDTYCSLCYCKSYCIKELREFRQCQKCRKEVQND